MIKLSKAALAVLLALFLTSGLCLAQTPADEVKQMLLSLIDLLEKGKLQEFVKLSTPPRVLEKASAEELKGFMAEFENNKDRILKMLKQTQGMEMRFNQDQTVAKFGKEGGLDHEISFHKIEGKWYLR